MNGATLDTIKRGLSPSQLPELERFGKRICSFGVNFAVNSADGEFSFLCESGRFKSDKQQLIEMSRQILSQQAEVANSLSRDTQVCQLGEHKQILAAVLRKESKELKSGPAGLVALIDLGPWSVAGNESCHGKSEQYEQLAEMLKSPSRTSSEYLTEMLRLFARSFQIETKAKEQIEMVSTELAQTYEELVLLHKLSINMKVTEADSNFLQMACDNLTEIVSVEGIVILLERSIDGDKQLAVAAGSGLIDINERMAGVLHSRLEDEINIGKEALLDSEVDSPFKYEWQGNIKSIIAVPMFSTEKSESHLRERIQNGSYIIGMMVAINRQDKEDFDSTDVKLFNSVANSCAVFIENGRLFKDLEELFIGSLKALTRSIDAKDKYTRGHSERVAFIARWIAERFSEQKSLEEEQLHKIYLAGLLHDVGKIGIDEVLLRKEGKLNDEEMERIRKHPSIGAGILREMKQMREIVPGVLYHHERVDGKGYPNGLKGDEIPLISKIIGLADSFDAITSKRTYRSARNIEQALKEIEKGLGTQFDEEIGRVFLNSDVHLLWDILIQNSPESVGIYGRSDLAEYGTAAVGTLIR